MDKVQQETLQWLKEVVIGLNLCPFAAKPFKKDQIRIAVSEGKSEEEVLETLLQEMLLLDNEPADVLETTLVVIPNFLQDFTDYNFFLDWVEALIKQQGYEGIYQVATFHPDYCFNGCEPEDVENLTNRSPYPVIHLIREESISKVLKHFPDPDSIPDTNIETVSKLTQDELQKLYPFLWR
ncbi:hypothetical protein JCM19241_5122 [Vibrio ishigakensis]|uniref:DUF1415 domain-containing protein n=1 Tax=Vibrio ishigakensis TaxID=1481914 RepID=A0A0B8Q5Z4_9VIBR|nr:hypothetical protein JCM19241_5122 [Vibrio ishigakensis]